MKSKFGIQLKKIPWEEVPDYKQMESQNQFHEKYATKNELNIPNASRVNEVMHKIILQHHLNAITVECFSLVKNNAGTACLSLSTLNDLGLPCRLRGRYYEYRRDNVYKSTD